MPQKKKKQIPKVEVKEVEPIKEEVVEEPIAEVKIDEVPEGQPKYAAVEIKRCKRCGAELDEKYSKCPNCFAPTSWNA